MYPIQIGFSFGLFGGNLLSTLGPSPAKRRKAISQAKSRKGLQNPMKSMYPIQIGEIYVPNSDCICFWICRRQFDKYPGPPPCKNAKSNFISRIKKHFQNLMKSMYPIHIGFLGGLFGGNLLSTRGAASPKM